MQDQIEKLALRVDDLEQWRNQQRVDTALNTERYSNINKRLDKIDGHITRLVWIVIGAVLSAVLAFVMNGGLNAAS